jgi:eukaryotic-like serine/threonine-protein kinase
VAGRYRLEHALGEGGMGVVWAATHEITRKKVALKLVKRADAPAQRTRLLREARASCAVRHPHVREVYDVVEDDDGSPMMIMEYLVGESLHDKLDREHKLALPEAAALLLPVVSAVGAAHALGIIHRDLKPANIFLGEGPAPMVKVLDFGIAKLTASDGDAAATEALTISGAMLGTPYYMSPEQAFGEKDIDHRTDIWALGLILYRCLSGILPTQADNHGQVFKNIVARPIRPMEQIAPDLPSDVTAVVRRMLSRACQDRPRDLHEVADVLAQYAGVTVPDFGAPARGAAPAKATLVSSTGATIPVDPLGETEDAPPSRGEDTEEPPLSSADARPPDSIARTHERRTIPLGAVGESAVAEGVKDPPPPRPIVATHASRRSLVAWGAAAAIVAGVIAAFVRANASHGAAVSGEPPAGVPAAPLVLSAPEPSLSSRVPASSAAPPVSSTLPSASLLPAPAPSAKTLPTLRSSPPAKTSVPPPSSTVTSVPAPPRHEGFY